MKISFNYKEIVNNATRSDNNTHCITEDEKKALQVCLYNMAVDLDNRCRKYGIKLFLVGGSLLGAVRHGGFIPWDDDIDLGASRNDYEKIKEIFDNEFSGDYELRCPNSKYPNGYRFMQIYKKGTILKKSGTINPFQPQSVYIDIFPCDNVPNNRFVRNLKGYFLNMLMLISSCVVDRYTDSYKSIIKNTTDGKLYLRLRQIIGTFFSFLPPQKWFDILDESVRHKYKTNFVTLAFGRKHYLGEICSAKSFFPLKEIKFSDHYFYSLADNDAYLKNLYGDDYMVLPNENKRESHFIMELKIDP